MMLWKKGMRVVAGAGILAAVFAGTAMAAEERTKITSIELIIDSDVQVGDESGDVSVTTMDPIILLRMSKLSMTMESGAVEMCRRWPLLWRQILITILVL